MTDLEAVAASLVETAAHLEQHIEARAQEIAAPQIEQATSAANLLIQQLEGELAVERQRREDVVREFQRHGKFCDRRDVEFKALKVQNQRVRLLRIDADARSGSAGFVTTDELLAALDGGEDPT